jgi:hypothetical protein
LRRRIPTLPPDFYCRRFFHFPLSTCGGGGSEKVISPYFKSGDFPMPETIEELRQRRDLLKEIAELSEKIDASGILTDLEEDAKTASKYLATLREIERCDVPDEDTIGEAAAHLSVLKELENYPPPDEDTIAETRDHLATLKEIESHVA